MALTDQKKRFIDRYFECGFNATEAILSLRPKITRESAATEGWRLLTDVEVKEEVRRREVEWRAKHRMTVQQFGDLLQEAATVDVLDFYNADGTLKRLTEIPPHARRQIAAIEPETMEVVESSGEGADKIEIRKTIITYKVKLWDLRKAQELWGKWKKMFTDKIEHTGEDGGPLRVSVQINGVKR